jgi:rubrerythrin
MDMPLRTRIDNVAEFFTQALALEREAAERYHELSHRMAQSGNKASADLFWDLAKFEAQHIKELEQRIAGMTLPVLRASASAWLDAQSPEVVPEGDITAEMTPHDALQAALKCERRAHNFFRQIAESVTNRDVQRLAVEMMNEESEHVHWVEAALVKLK